MPDLPVAEEKKSEEVQTGAIKVRIEHGEALLDLDGVNFVAGLAVANGEITCLNIGKLPTGPYMDLIVNMMELVNQMTAQLPKEQQRQLAAFVAHQAHMQQISGRMNKGIVRPGIVLARN